MHFIWKGVKTIIKKNVQNLEELFASVKDTPRERSILVQVKKFLVGKIPSLGQNT
jgi:hypothetical protein